MNGGKSKREHPREARKGEADRGEDGENTGHEGQPISATPKCPNFEVRPLAVEGFRVYRELTVWVSEVHASRKIPEGAHNSDVSVHELGPREKGSDPDW